jgi:Galactosyltransferase
MGKITAFSKFEARSILREAYTHFRIRGNDVVTVQFVVGLPHADARGMMDLLKWEQGRFGDMLILNIPENLDQGKVPYYFSSLAQMFPSDDPVQRPYDYAMKVDDDSFINIPSLLERLRPLTPREHTYMVSTPRKCKLLKCRAETGRLTISEPGTLSRGI